MENNLTIKLYAINMSTLGSDLKKISEKQHELRPCNGSGG
jgi:hypothetical protein